MSETQGTTLAETLRAYVNAHLSLERTLAVLGDGWSKDDALRYLRGYNEARSECAADIEENGALKRRVQELEAQLAERPQPAAVGVVGNISWAVVEGTGVTYRFGSREAAKNRAMRAGGRVVAIVDPDAVVPLASKEPVAWRDDQWGEGFFMRSVAAQSNTTTVTPLYAGAPEPARGEA